MFRTIFPSSETDNIERFFHWLPLPAHLTSEELELLALQKGIHVLGSHRFAMQNENRSSYVRVSIVLSPISRNNTAFWRAAAHQEIYMEFLKNPPGAGERSACDLLHFRYGFEIKMNFDRNVSCFVAVYGFMDRFL